MSVYEDISRDDVFNAIRFTRAMAITALPLEDQYSWQQRLEKGVPVRVWVQDLHEEIEDCLGFLPGLLEKGLLDSGTVSSARQILDQLAQISRETLEVSTCASPAVTQKWSELRNMALLVLLGVRPESAM